MPTKTANNTEDVSAYARKHTYPKVTDDEFSYITAECGRRGLDPRNRPFGINIDGDKRSVMWTLNGFLQIAHAASPPLVSIKNVQFGPLKRYVIGGVVYEKPESAKITVVRGWEAGRFVGSFSGIVYFKEYAGNYNIICNTHMVMEKLALAVALRTAFADVIGNNITIDEIKAGVKFDDRPIGSIREHAAEEKDSPAAEPVVLSAFTAPIVLSEEITKTVVAAEKRQKAADEAKRLLSEVFG